MTRAAIWFWCWIAYRIVMLMPSWMVVGRVGLTFLPWAGVYGYTPGGRAEFMANGLQRREPVTPTVTIILTSGDEP
jgi:hypothetical protein